MMCTNCLQCAFGRHRATLPGSVIAISKGWESANVRTNVLPRVRRNQ